jgi:hypothetical protein
MTKYGKCMLVAAGLALALAGGSTQAAKSAPADGGSIPSLGFERYDVNHDGVITRDEIPAGDVLLRARFASFDHDRNLRLDRREFAIAMESLTLPCYAYQGCESVAISPHPDYQSSLRSMTVTTPH